MTASLWSFWNTVAQPAIARLKPGEWTLLLTVAASLLVLCVFRERYLSIWAAAWTLLFGSRLVRLHGAGMHIPLRYLPAVEQAAFVIALGLLAGAVLAYIRSKNLLAPLAAVTVCVAGFAVTRALLWPDSLTLRVALEVSYRIVLLTAAIALLNARRGRGELWPWMLTAGLLSQHLNWPLIDAQIPSGVSIASDILSGIEHAAGRISGSACAVAAISCAALFDRKCRARPTAGRHDG